MHADDTAPDPDDLFDSGMKRDTYDVGETEFCVPTTPPAYWLNMMRVSSIEPGAQPEILFRLVWGGINDDTGEPTYLDGETWFDVTQAEGIGNQLIVNALLVKNGDITP